MKRARAMTAAGPVNLLLESSAGLGSALEVCAARGRDRGSFAGQVQFMGRAAWLKSSSLAGRARVRHAILRAALGAPPPRAREALNLHWLDARLFQVPRPLAAGWLGSGAPRWQFLVTEFVAATPLDAVLRRSEPVHRALLLTELARETARMHALHFVHRDLFLRNLLVLPEDRPRRLVFIDAWRGGERLQFRGAAYDLACLFLEGPSLLSPAEIRGWLAEYERERDALGKPIRPAQLWAGASRARRALLKRARAQPGRWRAPEPAVQDFDFAASAR